MAGQADVEGRPLGVISVTNVRDGVAEAYLSGSLAKSKQAGLCVNAGIKCCNRCLLDEFTIPFQGGGSPLEWKMAGPVLPESHSGRRRPITRQQREARDAGPTSQL
jgi:hypothetical protein